MNFVGEVAIDEGGPKREFFRLFIQQIIQSAKYMQGGTQKFFLANGPAILVNIHIYIWKGDFKLIGYYAGMSVTQGGPGFPLLTQTMYQYMSTGEIPSVHAEIDDENLPIQIKDLVNKVYMHVLNSNVPQGFIFV